MPPTPLTGLPLAIVPLYAGALALWFLILSIRVVLGRSGKGKPSLGDGGNPEMLRRIRGHANFAEYVPLILVLLALLEINGAPPWQLHALGGMLLAGRLMHGTALAFMRESVIGRSVGIGLTFLSLAAAGVLCLLPGLRAL